MEFRDKHFGEVVLKALDEAGLHPCYLQLELTESILMRSADSTESILDALKATGVQVAIDDFGTGYSSLSYLTRFPIDTLKIDQSFVHQIAASEGDTSIVTAIISMGHSLHMRVVAEGVETGRRKSSVSPRTKLRRGARLLFQPPSRCRSVRRIAKNRNITRNINRHHSRPIKRSSANPTPTHKNL